MIQYKTMRGGAIWSSATPPEGTQNILLASRLLLPPLITELHRSLRAWGDTGYSPGVIDPTRVFLNESGSLAFAFPNAAVPARLSVNVGAARDLAGWLVLLDKWMETFVVVARARHVWTPEELASALPFVSPVYLPQSLLEMTPVNWARVGRALAEAVSDGALRGGDEERAPSNSQPQKAKKARAKKSATVEAGDSTNDSAEAEPGESHRD